MATATERHRSDVSERLDAAEEAARSEIAGHVFPYCDAIYFHLCAVQKAAKGRALAASELGILRAAAIGVWPAHAKEHGLDVRLVSVLDFQRVSAMEWRWWFPVDAAEPVKTERGPLTLQEKTRLAGYYNRRITAQLTDRQLQALVRMSDHPTAAAETER